MRHAEKINHLKGKWTWLVEEHEVWTYYLNGGWGVRSYRLSQKESERLEKSESFFGVKIGDRLPYRITKQRFKVAALDNPLLDDEYSSARTYNRQSRRLEERNCLRSWQRGEYDDWFDVDERPERWACPVCGREDAHVCHYQSGKHAGGSFYSAPGMWSIME